MPITHPPQNRLCVSLCEPTFGDHSTALTPVLRNDATVEMVGRDKEAYACSDVLSNNVSLPILKTFSTGKKCYMLNFLLHGFSRARQ